MKVAVIGSRTFSDYKLLETTLKEYAISEVVSGAAIGADTLAKQFAIANDIPITEYPPDYKKYGRRAPLVRNQTIVDNSEIVIAFWDGKSRGSKFTMDYAEQQKKRVVVIPFIK